MHQQLWGYKVEDKLYVRVKKAEFHCHKAYTGTEV
jgi:hypothetical protein